jgi:hypothetical protein
MGHTKCNCRTVFAQEGFGIKIQQLYERFEEGSWFPVQLNYDFRFYNVELNGIQPVGIGPYLFKGYQDQSGP